MATAIQFLRSSTPRLRPNPADLASGMPMVNIAPEEPGLYFKTSDSQLVKIGPTFVGTVPPNDGATGFVGNTIGEMWLDVTNSATPILKIWDGLVWQEVSGGGNSDGIVNVGPKPPSPSEPGDLWFDTTNNELNYWNGTEWVTLPAGTDWNQADSSHPEFIKNKPTVTSEFGNDGEDGSSKYVTEVGVNNILSGNNIDGTPDPTSKQYVKYEDNTSVLTNNGEDGSSPFITEAGVNTILGDYVLGSAQITKTSELTNDGSDATDAGTTYIEDGDDLSRLDNSTTQYVTALNAPVLSVNGETGTVVLPLNKISDVSTTGAITNNVLVYNGSSWEAGAGVSTPPAVNLKGTFDVADINTLPASAVVGDTYVQKSVVAGQPSIADAAWPNIAGASVDDGAFVYYVDVAGNGTWVIGSNNVSSFQSDWDEANAASNSFIKNKPSIYDSTITLFESDGSTTVGSFSTNQALPSNISLPKTNAVLTISEVSNGVTTDTTFSAGATLDVGYTVGAGTLSIFASDGVTEVGTFGANQSGDVDITLPAGMIEPTANNTWVRKKNGTAFTWEISNLENITNAGATSSLKVTTLSLESTEITNAADGAYGDSVTPTGNVMPLDIRKLPSFLPVTTRIVDFLRYSVTVNNPGSGNVYYLNGDEQPALTVKVGDSLIFYYSDDSNTGHPMAIYTDSTQTTQVSDGVTNNAVAETLTFNP